MAGRCRVMIRAMAGVLGVVAAPLIAIRVDPSIMDPLEDLLAERLGIMAKRNLPPLMPEIPFIPTATVKVEEMLDTNWAYYLGLVMLIVSFLPTIVQFGRLFWNIQKSNGCRDLLIIGEAELLDEYDVLPSADIAWAPLSRHRAATKPLVPAIDVCSEGDEATAGSCNGALTLRKSPAVLSFSAINGTGVNLSPLFHGSRAERLVLATMLRFMFMNLQGDLSIYRQFLGFACQDLHTTDVAARHLFMALCSLTYTSLVLRKCNDSQHNELSAARQELCNEQAHNSALKSDLQDRDETISELGTAQQESDARMTALTKSQEELQTEKRANEKVIKILRAQIAGGDQKSGSPAVEATSTGGDQPPATTRAVRFPMGDIFKQKISDLEKENKTLRAQSTACTCSPSTHNMGPGQPSVHNDDKVTLSKTKVSSGSASGATSTPPAHPTTGNPDSAAPHHSGPARDEPEHAQSDRSNVGEDETAEGTPKGSGRKKRRRRVRRGPNGKANDVAAAGPSVDGEAQGDDGVDDA
ncbi:MAG: hypothetical protein Q9169_007787 [Polycauliona sp. 2 TL-2023]